MCRPSILHNGSSLRSGNNELKNGYLGLIPMERRHVGVLDRAGTGNIANSLQYRHYPSMILFRCSSSIKVLWLSQRSLGSGCVPVVVEVTWKVGGCHRVLLDW
jgi:hypothetical protein